MGGKLPLSAAHAPSSCVLVGYTFENLTFGAPSTPAEVWRTVTRGKQPSAMDWRTMENVPVIMACRRSGIRVKDQAIGLAYHHGLHVISRLAIKIACRKCLYDGLRITSCMDSGHKVLGSADQFRGTRQTHHHSQHQRSRTSAAILLRNMSVAANPAWFLQVTGNMEELQVTGTMEEMSKRAPGWPRMQRRWR